MLPIMTAPNILFLLSDQQRWDTLGVLNDKIKTPNLDRLANSGMLMERAYPATPVCLPCRASFLSGQYPSTNGATHNWAELREDHTPLLSSVLRDRGYYTHMIGKSHLSCCFDPLGKESAPFIHNREYYRQWKGPWYGFERADINIGHTTEKHACGMHYGAWLEDQGVDTAKYFGHTRYEQYGTWDLPEEFHSSKWIADITKQAMQRSGDRGQPFFIWANFQDPHNPCMVPAPWSTMYDPNEIPRFGYKPGEPECYKDKPPFYGEIIAQPGPYAAHPSDPWLESAGNISHLAWSQEQIQQNAACYYGMISLMDKYIGQILDELERLGQADNTIVVFASDHGDVLGDHGFWWKSIVSCEESIRVPLIARYPGHIAAGTRTRAFQSLIDLFPTFCDYAGAPTPFACEGVSQRTVWDGTAPAVRDDVIIEERPNNSPWTQRILVTDDFKLAWYAGRDYGELYDLHTDPDHIRNLWNDPSHQQVKHSLIHRVLTHETTKSYPAVGPAERQRRMYPA
jgi:arylsulfatase A-like enzyme